MSEHEDQDDLFEGHLPPASLAAVLREERRYGTWDARTGFPLDNAYRSQLSGDRLSEYETAYREETARLVSAGVSP